MLLSAVHARSSALQQPPPKILAHDEDECCALTEAGAAADDGASEEFCDAESGGAFRSSDDDGAESEETRALSPLRAESGRNAAALSPAALRLRRWTRPLRIFYKQEVRRSGLTYKRLVLRSPASVPLILPKCLLRQPQVFRPMVAYSFLYITVLSMGFLMTSYVQWAGMPLDEISIFRGFGETNAECRTTYRKALLPPIPAPEKAEDGV